MTPYDEIESDRHPVLSTFLNVLLFLLVQGLAVLPVGVTALFLNFDRAWSAENPQPARPTLTFFITTLRTSATQMTDVPLHCAPRALCCIS